MRPSEVLDAQTDMLGRFDDPKFRRLLGAWVGTNMALNKVARADTERAVRVMHGHLKVSYAYRVTHDMSLMVEWTASQLDGTDQFLRDLAPTPAGFVAFDRPLVLIDGRGKTMHVNFLTWGPGQARMPSGENRDATLAVCWNDQWRDPDQVAREMAENDPEAYRFYRESMGRWATIGLDSIVSGQRLGPATIIPSEDWAAEILADGDTPTPGTNLTRYIHALFLLLGQTVARTEVEIPDRASRRRAGRAGLPAQVTVIRLRREENSGPRPEGESGVEWQCRWISRQHWRWQPYGRKVDHQHEYGPIENDRGGLVRRCMVEGCDGHIARIIIPMSIKGPKDKPIARSERVYSLER